MRVYNNKISKRANESLRKRALTVRMEKILIFSMIVIAFTLIIFLTNAIKTFANSNFSAKVKCYTSYTVKSQDTLWDIADNYYNSTDLTKKEYIDEICQLNHISEDHIKAGDNIVLTYYDVE